MVMMIVFFFFSCLITIPVSPVLAVLGARPSSLLALRHKDLLFSAIPIDAVGSRGLRGNVQSVISELEEHPPFLELISALRATTNSDRNLDGLFDLPGGARLRSAVLVAIDLLESPDSRAADNRDEYAHPHLPNQPPRIRRSGLRGSQGIVPTLADLATPIDPANFKWPYPDPLPGYASALQRSAFQRNKRIVRAFNNLRRHPQMVDKVLAVHVTLPKEKQRAHKPPRAVGRCSSSTSWDSVAFFAYLLFHANGDTFATSLQQGLPADFRLNPDWKEQFVIGKFKEHRGFKGYAPKQEHAQVGA
jgi:hypothetical protein